MINRSIQFFLQDTYGDDAWGTVAARAGLRADGFEALLDYRPGQTQALLAAAVRHLGKPEEMLLEDLGTYLVSHPHMQAIRRLLRFGGPTFVEFLHSLDELPDRARLAVPDLSLPALTLEDRGGGSYALRVQHPVAGFGQVMVGILRALADDYGVLVLLDHAGRVDGADSLSIQVAEESFAEGRRFDLRRRAV